MGGGGNQGQDRRLNILGSKYISVTYRYHIVSDGKSKTKFWQLNKKQLKSKAKNYLLKNHNKNVSNT